MRKQAFTLVELSIVLVILGLLVGGVLAGQSLIRSAELRAIATEKTSYETAINAFKEKYFALPGDMSNAYQFWGTACGTNTTTISTGCNGDGDGKVTADANGEDVKAWEHLSRAGLITGNFDGTGTVNSTYVIYSTTNLPKSRFPSAYWNLSNNPANAYDASGANLPVASGLYLSIGSITPNIYISLSELPSLTNAEAWNIDTKLDDGRAGTGAVRGSGNLDCYDNGTDYYELTTMASATGQCVLWFVLKRG